MVSLNPVSDPTVGSEDPHVIGPRGGTEICDWLDLLDQISPNLAKFERNCASSLIGQWTLNNSPASLIGRETVFGAFRG